MKRITPYLVAAVLALASYTVQAGPNNFNPTAFGHASEQGIAHSSGNSALHGGGAGGGGGGGNPGAGNGGGNGGGNNTGNSNSGKSGKSKGAKLLKAAVITAIAAVAVYVVYCIVTEDTSVPEDKRTCKRTPEPVDEYGLVLVSNTTNLYARNW